MNLVFWNIIMAPHSYDVFQENKKKKREWISKVQHSFRFLFVLLLTEFYQFLTFFLSDREMPKEFRRKLKAVNRIKNNTKSTSEQKMKNTKNR